MALVTIVIPVHNESACLETLLERLVSVQNSAEHEFDYIFVDDGSTDDSREIVLGLAKKHKSVGYLFLSRNFGQEAAMMAGLDHAEGDAVILMDADLQDPPEVVPRLIEKWQEGYQAIHTQRISRVGESWNKKFTSRLFYRFIRALSDVDIPADIGNFRLLDRVIVKQLRQCREQSRFTRGLTAWVGFKQAVVPFEPGERYAGRTKYNVFKLTTLALDAILGFSSFPLRLGVYVGIVICLLSFLMGIRIIVLKLFFDIPFEGYAVMVTGMFFLGGVQLSLLGLIGEYIGRVYRQSQERPIYVVAEKSTTLGSVEAADSGVNQ